MAKFHQLSAQLVVSVVSNIVDITSLKYMQDMTAARCAATSEGKEVQLEDSRDSNKYWVGKMKDGKCWMLQNLALGSTSTITPLATTDSNVASDWSLPTAYTTATSGSSSSNTVIQVWDFGKWVLATPLLTTSCGESGVTSLASCTKVGLVDVSDTTKFQPGYSATTSNWEGANATDNTLVAVNCTAWSGSGTSKKCTAGTYDAHYLVGNYYSWNAATAGTGGNITSGQATGSICPKGWKLPTSNSTATGSFAGLLSQYGVSSSLSGTVGGTTYNIAGAPLRFVRGGFAHPGSYFVYAGRYGSYWSSTPYSSRFAYYLDFYDSSVNPSDGNSRYLGQSVRCIAE